MNTSANHNSDYSVPLKTHFKKGELYSVRRENFESEQSTAFNRHDHLELILVENGTLGCFVENGFYTAVAEELVVINPLQTHRLMRVTAEPLNAWVLSFDEKLVPLDNGEPLNHNFEGLIKDKTVIDLFRTIIREKRANQPWSTLYIQNLIQLILLQLLRKYTKTVSEKESVPPLLQSIFAYIHGHYSQPLTLETIGDAVGISRWYLSKFFRKETGMSIVEYINQYRCSHALALLLKSPHPISKISEMCGFSSLEYFSRVYTKQYGHAPSFERELQGTSDVSLGLFASSLAASESPAPKNDTASQPPEPQTKSQPQKTKTEESSN